MKKIIMYDKTFIQINSNRVIIVCMFTIVLGAILRVSDLYAKSFWTDELLSIWHAQDIIDLSTFFSPLWGNAHPPLYFLLLKVWSLGGDGEFYLRLLSVIFGVLVIPATYLLSGEFFDQKTSLVGALLIAISPLHILYDREVRMYSLFALLTIISLYFFIRALREGKNSLWAAYTVFTVLNTYTHYHAFLVILSQWIFYIYKFKHCRHFVRQAIISQTVIAIGFSFWLPTFLYHLEKFSMLGEETTRFPVTLGAWIKPIYLFFSFSIGQTVLPWNYMIVIPAAIIFLGAFIWAIKSMLKENGTLQFFLIFLFIPILAGLFISDMMPRYFLFLTPIYSLIIAKGISSFPGAKVKIFSLMIIIILLSFSLKNYYANKEFHVFAHIDPWREVGNYLKENVKNDVVFNIGGVPINYYTGFNIPILETNAMQVIEDKLTQRKQFNRIWLIISNPKYKKESEEAFRWINRRYNLISEKRYMEDPDYMRKTRLFKKDFMEYRIRVYSFQYEGL